MTHKHEVTITEAEFRKGIEKYAEEKKLEFYNCAILIVDRYWSTSEYTDIL
jgi:hypothetical protein